MARETLIDRISYHCGELERCLGEARAEREDRARDVAAMDHAIAEAEQAFRRATTRAMSARRPRHLMGHESHGLTGPVRDGGESQN